MAARRRRMPSAASSGSTELLPLPEVLAELRVARSTFYGWLQQGRGPRCIQYPNKKLMVRRADLDEWLAKREVNA